eukprot:scaffold188531_cov32-Tisochrysis_lutea.AAC.2
MWNRELKSRQGAESSKRTIPAMLQHTQHRALSPRTGTSGAHAPELVVPSILVIGSLYGPQNDNRPVFGLNSRPQVRLVRQGKLKA